MFADNALRQSIHALASAATDVIVSPGRAAVITHKQRLPNLDRDGSIPDPELQLFHFGFSICSQKVRAVLDELNVEYGSNQYAGPIEYENYTPQYVRLRLASEIAQHTNFVSSYSGGSSVESEGFDPLVVPTLVDTGSGKVLADSKLICLHLARGKRDRIDLLPADLESQIMMQIDAVDRTPHVALLYGANPQHDTRPEEIQTRMPGIYEKKYKKIKDFMAQVPDEPALLAAYEAKLKKEEAAEHFVVDAAEMSAAITLSESLVQGLDDTLVDSSGPWIFGDRFTLADIFWGVSLVRLDYIGNSAFWDGKPPRSRVKAYYERIIKRQCIVNGVLQWPGSGRRNPTT